MKTRLLALAFCLLSIVAFADVILVPGVELHAGWNLVTLRCPIAQGDVASLLALGPMRFDAANQCYVRCTSASDIKVGVGYWVFISGTPVLLPPDMTQASWQTAGLGSGWSLIGMASNSSWQSQATAIWQWQNGGFQKVAAGDLVTGQAYWAKP